VNLNHINPFSTTNVEQQTGKMHMMSCIPLNYIVYLMRIAYRSTRFVSSRCAPACSRRKKTTKSIHTMRANHQFFTGIDPAMETGIRTHACSNPKLQPIQAKLANSSRGKEWNSIMVFDLDEEVVGNAELVGNANVVVGVEQLQQILVTMVG
jgi:hypothetical protein